MIIQLGGNGLENKGNTQNSNHTSRTNTMNAENSSTNAKKNSMNSTTTNITENTKMRDGQNSKGNMIDYVSGDSARSSSSHVFHKNDSEKS